MTAQSNQLPVVTKTILRVVVKRTFLLGYRCDPRKRAQSKHPTVVQIKWNAYGLVARMDEVPRLPLILDCWVSLLTRFDPIRFGNVSRMFTILLKGGADKSFL